MAIVLHCECGRKLQIKDEFAGQEGQCPACSRTFLIPAANTMAEPAARLQSAAVELPDPDREPPSAEAPESSEPINNHGGEPLPPDADFFADPPSEIGPILSAYTTLRRGVAPWSSGGRFTLAAFLGLVGALISLVIMLAVDPRNLIAYLLLPLVLGGIFLAIAILSTGFKHRCTYIGREGVARIKCAGTRDDIVSEEVFRFRDAAELRTGQTRRYVNGGYQGTDYRYTWSDVGGRTRYTISGTHKSEKGNPPSTDPYQFGRAAEIAWTIYLLDQTFRQMELNGMVLFNLKGTQWIRLGRGFIVMSSGGAEEQWTQDEIEVVNVDQGVVRIKRRDAKEGWFSSTGVFKFSFDNLANAQLFFHLCEKVVGVAVG